MAGNSMFKGHWVIDSGAIEHITCNENLLQEKFTSNLYPVRIPNGMNVPIKGLGNVVLDNGMKLHNIMHIPDFQCNLLSVSKLTRDYNCAIIFVADFCVMQDLHSRNLIGLGKHQDGLYILEPTQDKRIALKVSKTNEDSLWHARLGHTSEDKIKTIGFDVVKNQDRLLCDSCIRAKQTRLAFPISTIKTDSCFDLIHCDIWGRYSTCQPLELIVSFLLLMIFVRAFGYTS